MPKQTAITFDKFFEQDLTCEILVQSLYDLNHLEFDLYCSLLMIKESGEEADVSNLMDKVGRTDRTMVNRSLSSLLEKGLCERKKESKVGQRGYWYTYEPTPLSDLKDQLLYKLQKWHSDAIKQIEKIEVQFEGKMERKLKH